MKFSERLKAAKEFDKWAHAQEKELGSRLKKGADLVFAWLVETPEGHVVLARMNHEVNKGES